MRLCQFAVCEENLGSRATAFSSKSILRNASRRADASSRKLTGTITSAQIELVSLRIPCRRLIQRRLSRAESCVRNRTATERVDFILQGEHISDRLFVRSSPGVVVITAISESQRNAHNVIRSPDGAFQQMSYSQLASDGRKIALLSRQIRTSNFLVRLLSGWQVEPGRPRSHPAFPR